MSAVLVGRFEPGSPEWHAAREHGLGGSEVAALLGLSPWESRFALWHRKAGLIGPVEESEVMDAGKRLEPAIVQKFRDNHPEWRVGGQATFRHHERRWQIGNPDGLIYTDPQDYLDLTKTSAPQMLLEAKYALYDDHWGEPGTDEIPIWYRCQVQWYLDVFSLDTCYVEVFIGSQGQFREYIVKADPTDQRALREAAAEFLADVERDVRPDIDAHDQTYAAIRELHPLIDPVKVEVPAKVAEAFCLTKMVAKLAQADAQEATAILADCMGNAKTATYLNQTIATRQARGDGDPYVVAARNLPTFDTEMSAAS
jgi:putative phage-type endonuclease